MSEPPIAVSLESVRRLAVAKQHLAGPLPGRVTTTSVLSVFRDLAYVQWDPVSVVAPSHLIALGARLGKFRAADLDRLLWKEKVLFEHWLPMASLVLTEDYPLYNSLMRRYPGSLTHSWGNHRDRARRFLAGHAALRRRMLREIRDGPIQLSEFEDHLRTKREAGEWGFGSDVAQMLFHLSMSGDAMVVGHRGNQNLWGSAEGFFPPGLDRTALSAEEFERAAAQRALRAQGTATPREIVLYFPRGRYERLTATLSRLEEDELIHRIAIKGAGAREERYVHTRDLAQLESLGTSAWRPRMSLLPPFDNMVSNQGRTRRLFGFEYVREQFLPKEKRRYGTYVLPILWGERFIGRIDPRLDRSTGELVVNAVHAEPGAPADRAVAEELGAAVFGLADLVGAKRVRYGSRIPSAWKGALR